MRSSWTEESGAGDFPWKSGVINQTNQTNQSITGNLNFSSFPEKATSQPWLTSSVDHGIFVHRKFPFKKIGQSENCGDLFSLSLNFIKWKTKKAQPSRMRGHIQSRTARQ